MSMPARATPAGDSKRERKSGLSLPGRPKEAPSGMGRSLPRDQMWHLRLRLDHITVQTQLIDQFAEFGRPRQECIGAGIDWEPSQPHSVDLAADTR